MRKECKGKDRSAFTLVEMLVVIGIIVALAAITLLFLPSRQSTLSSDAAVGLQTWISSSKGKALKDVTPTGIRFLTSDGGNTFYGCQIVQLPTRLVPLEPNLFPPYPKQAWTVYLRFPTPPTYPLAQYPNWQISPPPPYTVTQIGSDVSSLLPGDVLEIVETCPESENRILAVNGNQISLVTQWGVDSTNKNLVVQNLPSVACMSATVLGKNYRYLRQVQPLIGEPVFNFPKDVVIYGNPPTTLTQGVVTPYSLNLTPDASGNYQIIFAPSGQTTGYAAPVILWIWDVNRISAPALLRISPATGFCDYYPVNDNPNTPFQYAQLGL